MLVYPAYADGSFPNKNSRVDGAQVDKQRINVVNGSDDPSIEQLKAIQKELEHIANRNDIPWEALVALLLGLVGIFKFQDYLDKKWLNRPRWDISFKLAPPDSHKIALRNQTSGQRICDTYYFRFRITNNGNHQMEDIEVMVEELYKKGRGSNYTKIQNFLPLNLVWAHNHLVTMPKIQPKLFKHCDFAHIVETQYLNLGQFGITSNSNVAMLLDTYVQPNTGSHIILPGKYKMKVIFAANNLSPKVVWFKLEFKNVWDSNEQRMLSRNVIIEQIDN